MKELSIFVDESGDFGEYDHHSPFYIISMVLHDHITWSNEKLTSSCPCKNGLYDDFEERKPKKVPWRDLKSVLKSGYRF